MDVARRLQALGRGPGRSLSDRPSPTDVCAAMSDRVNERQLGPDHALEKTYRSVRLPGQISPVLNEGRLKLIGHPGPN
jgi:hypothetical protein